MRTLHVSKQQLERELDLTWIAEGGADRAKVGLPSVAAGAPKKGVFVILNDSPRNSRFQLSRMAKLLKIEKSRLLCEGVYRMSRPALPIMKDDWVRKAPTTSCLSAKLIPVSRNNWFRAGNSTEFTSAPQACRSP